MFKKQQLVKKVYLEPQYLDSDLKETLLKKVRSVYVKDCFKQIGYISEINTIEEILDNDISSCNSKICFTLKLNIVALKPILNQTIDGTVAMFFKNGILIIVCNCLKILIPSNSIEGDYDHINNRFGPYTLGQILRVKIVNIKYDNKNYCCIGHLK